MRQINLKDATQQLGSLIDAALHGEAVKASIQPMTEKKEKMPVVSADVAFDKYEINRVW